MVDYCRGSWNILWGNFLIRVLYAYEINTRFPGQAWLTNFIKGVK